MTKNKPREECGLTLAKSNYPPKKNITGTRRAGKKGPGGGVVCELTGSSEAG